MKKIKLIISLLLIISVITLTPVKAVSSSLTVSVGKNTITIKVKNVGKKGTAQLYAYNANEYANDDSYFGISDDFSDTGILVGDYTCGTTQTFTRERVDENGADRLYQKYYVIQNGKVLKGPVYATSITPLTNTKVTFKQKSVKGLYNENSTNMKYAKDLKVSSITINLNLADLFNFGKDHTNDTEFVSNGKTYYVKNSSIVKYDALISAASKNNMNVIAVVAPWVTKDRNSYPNALRYSKYGSVTMGTNTSNDTGREEYIALMEYLAARYSQNKNTGFISTYVISNEVDFTPYFYDCDDFDTYMEEYTRSLRLANLAVKKYASDANVAIPLTHYWKGDQKKLGKECKGNSYIPYNMLQWMVKHESARGNYDWAIAPHSYAWISPTTNIANSDTAKHRKKYFTGSYKTTKVITYSNLEVYDQYLSLSSVKYKGKKRSMYLTESGVSSNTYSTKHFNKQIMSMYQTYYKVANLKFIKSYNYYRLRDDKSEYATHLTTGLLKKNGQKKPVYNIYKYIDTKTGYKRSKKYLKLVTYKYNSKTRWNYKNGKVRSWKKAMQVFNTGYNWNKKFKMSNVYRK